MKLQDWCNKNEWEHKVLLTDNKKNVSRLKRIVNEAGCIIKNLDDYRFEDLAKIIVIEKLVNEGIFVPFEVLETDDSALLINKLVLSETEKYNSIPKECLCIETSKEIYRVMNIMRMGKTTQEYDALTDGRDGQIKQLIDEYEKELEKNNQYDGVRLIKEATAALKDKKLEIDYQIGIFSYMEDKLTYSEKQFLDALTDAPTWIDSDRDSEVNAVFYKIYGQSNEIQTVIKEIKAKKYIYGETSILYTSQEYLNGIMASLDESGIKYCVTTGRSMMEEPYVSLLLSLIAWAMDGYSYESFRSVANHVLIRLSSDYSFGVKAGIGWGLDRYQLVIDLMKNRKNDYEKLLLKHKIIKQKKDKDGKELPLETCSDQYIEVIEKLVNLFTALQKPPFNLGNIYRQLLFSLKDIVGKTRRENGKSFTELKHMQRFFDHYGKVESFDEALRVINYSISSMETCDEEVSDAVSIIKIGRMEVLERPNIFCIGLSYEAFGVKVSDSPVISDKRLKELLETNSGYVEQAMERNSIKKDILLKSLKTMPEGNLFVSACEYDSIHFRDLALSEVYMDLMKEYGCIEECIIHEGYQKVHDHYKNYKINKEVLFPKNMVVEEEKKDAKKSSENDQEKQNEQKDNQNEKIYKGYVIEEKDGKNTVIRIPKLSPSKLQELMGCPWKFDYSIKYFDRTNPDKDVTVWLKPDSRGSFFHQVFQDYFDEAKMNKPLSPADTLDEGLLRSIYDKTIREFEILVPKGSKQAFELESTVMWDQIKKYLIQLYDEFKSDGKEWCVKECERGFVSKEYCFDSEGNEISVDEPCDRIIVSFTGSLDRVDQYIDEAGKEHIRIVDYKTGKKKTTEEKIKNYTELQHIIYSMTAEEDVECFSYVFPCDDNEKLDKKGSDISALPEAVRKKMADVLINKKYQLLNDDDEDDENESKSPCKYCDYKDICVHKMGLE